MWKEFALKRGIIHSKHVARVAPGPAMKVVLFLMSNEVAAWKAVENMRRIKFRCATGDTQKLLYNWPKTRN